MEVYGVRPSVRPSSSSVVRREHFQTTSPLKPLRNADPSHISHIASVGRGNK